jgi:hypothetical protein
VALSRQTDLLGVQADVLLDLADVLIAVEHSDEAEAALVDAAALCDSKGHLVGAAHARGRLAALGGSRRA